MCITITQRTPPRLAWSSAKIPPPLTGGHMNLLVWSSEVRFAFYALQQLMNTWSQHQDLLLAPYTSPISWLFTRWATHVASQWISTPAWKTAICASYSIWGCLSWKGQTIIIMTLVGASARRSSLDIFAGNVVSLAVGLRRPFLLLPDMSPSDHQPKQAL